MRKALSEPGSSRRALVRLLAVCLVGCAEPGLVAPPPASPTEPAKPGVRAPSQPPQQHEDSTAGVMPESEPTAARVSVHERSPEEEEQLRRRLSVISEYPSRLASPPERLRSAKRSLDRARRLLSKGTWRELQRLDCPTERGFPEHLAVVRDDADRVRAFTRLGGSDDSAASTRYLFDESGRLRLLLYLRAAVDGAHDENIVVVDAAGKVAVCDHRTVHVGALNVDLCYEEPPEVLEPVDPDVEAAVRSGRQDRATRRNGFLDALLDVEPEEKWNRCPSGRSE